jgi:hypothetical protein
VRREIQLSISCRDCIRRSTPDCDDCLVSYVLGEAPDQLTLSSEEAEAADLLTAQGLVPRLRFVSPSSAP